MGAYSGGLLTSLVLDCDFPGDGTDQSGNGRNLTEVNSPTYGTLGGNAGQYGAIDSGVNNAYWNRADEAALRLADNGAFTIMMLFRGRKTTTNPHFWKGTSADNTEYGCYSTTALIFRKGYGTGRNEVQTSAQYSSNTWHIAFFAFDPTDTGQEMRIECNDYNAGGGQTRKGWVTGGSNGTVVTASDFVLGKIAYSTTTGENDYARFSMWQRRLTETEFDDLFNGGAFWEGSASVRLLRVGGTQVQNVRVGNQQAVQVRRGSTVVWTP